MVKVRVINIYKTTHLPHVGWLQGCYICSSITGKTINHNQPKICEKTKFVVHMCHICHICQHLLRENKQLQDEYQSFVNSYIYKN